jgi:phosphatidate cytidylyltransferase
MLRERLIVVIFLVPLGVLAIAVGGWIFSLVITAILAAAAWEFWRIFKKGGYSPSVTLLMGGVILVSISRAIFNLQYSDLVISVIVTVSLAWFVFAFEKGENQAAVDFGITLGGIFYLGWLGSYLISLRAQPDGTHWLLLTIAAISLADAGAYIFGRRFGTHKMCPRVSPHKTWEGYIGGIFFSALFTSLIAALWGQSVPGISWQDGLILALVMGILGPLGDLGESLFKRQFGIKDSSNLIPGHGGVMDRIDTWIWAAAICYYLINWLNLPA